jgi:hypothetical protein
MTVYKLLGYVKVGSDEWYSQSILQEPGIGIGA